MGNWDGNLHHIWQVKNCTFVILSVTAEADVARVTSVNHQNHSKNDGSSHDSIHKIFIIICGLANLRCFVGWGGGCRHNCPCGKYERNGFQRVHCTRAAMFVSMFASISTQSYSAHVEETDQELLHAHSQTRKHWGRECVRMCTFSHLGPVGFFKWSSKANRGGWLQ